MDLGDLNGATVLADRAVRRQPQRVLLRLGLDNAVAGHSRVATVGGGAIRRDRRRRADPAPPGRRGLRRGRPSMRPIWP